jgi:hypothetical protein
LHAFRLRAPALAQAAVPAPDEPRPPGAKKQVSVLETLGTFLSSYLGQNAAFCTRQSMDVQKFLLIFFSDSELENLPSPAGLKYPVKQSALPISRASFSGLPTSNGRSPKTAS